MKRSTHESAIRGTGGLSVSVGVCWLIFALLLTTPSVTWAQSETDTSEADTKATVKKLAEELQSGDLEKKRDAAYALAKLGAKAQPVLKTLIDTLNSERDSQVWVQTAATVARIGPAARDAIPVLVEQLGNRDDQRRFRAAYALARIGVSSVPELKKSLSSRSPDVRASAASALSQMGPDANDAIPDLVIALGDSESQVRENAAEALQKVGPAAQAQLLKAVAGSKTGKSAAAIRVLGRMGKLTDDVRAAVGAALDSEDAPVRAAAMSAAFIAGLETKQAETLLRRALTDTAEEVRDVGLLELRRRKQSAGDSQPLLMELLDSDRPEVARTAATGIGILGEAGEASVPALIRLLQNQTDDDPTIMRAIARIGPVAVPHLLSVEEPPQSSGLVEKALAEIGSNATDALIAAMQSDNENVRLRAIRSLGRMEGLNSETFASIVTRLQDSDARIREAAAISIGQAAQLEQDNAAFLALTKAAADPEPAVRTAALISMSSAAAKGVRQVVVRKFVKAALNDPDANVRRGGLTAIAKSPEIAHRFIEQLIQGLQDGQPHVRAEAAAALSNVKPDSLKDSESMEPVAAVLVKAMADSSDEVKARAAAAVGRTTAVNDQSVAALSNLLENSNPSVVRPAIESLAALGSQSGSALASFMKLDNHPNAEIRAAVASALPDISDDPQRILSPLLTLLKDKDWAVRREAAHALGDIGSPAASAVPTLFKMLDVDDDKDFARAALREIDDADADAVPVLIDGLKSGDRRKVYYAVFLLTKIGPAAKAAIPHLVAAGKESDSGRLRGMIDRAIEAIDVKPKEETVSEKE